MRTTGGAVRRARARAMARVPDGDPCAIALPVVPVFLVAPPSPRSGSPARRRSSFEEAMRPALLAAQVFGAFPLNATPLGRVVRTAVLLSLVVLVAVMAGATMIMEGIGLASSSTFVFYVLTASALVLLSLLSGRWGAVCAEWRLLAGRGLGAGYVRRVRAVTTLLLLLSLCTCAVLCLEFTLSSLNAVIPILKCSAEGGAWTVYKTFIAGKFPLIVQVVPYSMWFSLPLLYINILCTFLWNYVDILVIIVSSLLAKRFERFNHSLEKARGKECSALWWREVREEYNCLAMLTKQMDEHLSPLVFLSFASNLYFICLQLLYNLMPKEEAISFVYFYFSFFWLLTRAALVSMRASSVYEKSIGPVDMLFSVSSKSFCTEVERLLIQTTTDTVALSGCRFFWVTRSLVLTLAGTVATFEIVLVQFHADTNYAKENRTSECFV